MNRLLTYLILIIVASAAVGCSKSNPEQLNSNTTITSIYTTAVIDDLNKILSFFENQICAENNHTHSGKCYESYLKSISDIMDNEGQILINIPYKEQLTMFEELDTSTVNQIWSYGEITNMHTKDTLIELRYNIRGKHVKMMYEMSLEDELMKYYYDMWQEWYTLQVITSGKTLENYKNYDIDDVRMKLVVAIHYLTMNDNFERNKK